MLRVFAAVAALCGATAPWAALPLVAAVCWGCYEGLVIPQDDADLRALALLSAFALLGRLLAGPVERAALWRADAERRATEANPLFRPDDRRRARLRRSRSRLLLTSLGLGVALGLAVHAHGAAAADAVRRHAHPVTATTLADAVPPPAGKTTPRGVAVPVVGVPAVWEYPAGARHVGRVVVFRRQAAGARETVWVDDAGRLVVQPASGADQAVLGALVGLTGAVGSAALAMGCCWVLRSRLDRRAARAWAQDWARVEPHWSGRHRNEDVGR